MSDPNINYLELESPYPYTPDLATCLSYTIIFGLLTLIHCVLAIRYRYWVMLYVLVPGGLLEVLGWAGRLWSHYQVLDSDPFIMQMCCLIIGPAFFSAWAYTALGYCINLLGASYSLLNPRTYIIGFLSADIVCLVLQAAGGALAAEAAEKNEDKDPGTNIMLAGVLVQLGTMTLFTVLAIDFITRVITRKPYTHRTKSTSTVSRDSDIEALPIPTDKLESTTPFTPIDTSSSPISSSVDTEASQRLRKSFIFLGGIAFASAMIYARGVYRSIELAQGWTGVLMTTEVYFTWLDGLPMVLAYAAFAVLHPGWLIKREQAE